MSNNANGASFPHSHVSLQELDCHHDMNGKHGHPDGPFLSSEQSGVLFFEKHLPVSQQRGTLHGSKNFWNAHISGIRAENIPKRLAHSQERPDRLLKSSQSSASEITALHNVSAMSNFHPLHGEPESFMMVEDSKMATNLSSEESISQIILVQPRDLSTPTSLGTKSMQRGHPKRSNSTLSSSSKPHLKVITQDHENQTSQITTKSQKHWEEVQGLRAYVRSLRSQLNDSRATLHERQSAKSNAEDAFIQFIRRKRYQAQNSGEEHFSWSTFDSLFSVYEQLRDECGPVEDECAALERGLSFQEFTLSNLESNLHLYERPATFNLQLKADNEELSESSNSGHSDDSEEYFHPLVREYLSKVGDVDILRERLDWHLDEKENLEEEKKVRHRVNLKLPTEDQEWLDDADRLERELLAQLKTEEDSAEKLRLRCVSIGLLDQETQPTTFKNREQQSFITEFSTTHQSSGFVNFPILIPPPSGLQWRFLEMDARSTEEQKAEGEMSTTRSRVNLWLLHQLRMSPLEVRLLASVFEDRVGEIQDEEHWQENVLEHWFHDTAFEEWTPPATDVTAVIDNTFDDVVPYANSSPSALLVLQQKQASVGTSPSYSTLQIVGSIRSEDELTFEPILNSTSDRSFFDNFILSRWFDNNGHVKPARITA